jgi:hypothetical protein
VGFVLGIIDGWLHATNWRKYALGLRIPCIGLGVRSEWTLCRYYKSLLSRAYEDYGPWRPPPPRMMGQGRGRSRSLAARDTARLTGMEPMAEYFLLHVEISRLRDAIPILPGNNRRIIHLASRKSRVATSMCSSSMGQEWARP